MCKLVGHHLEIIQFKFSIVFVRYVCHCMRYSILVAPLGDSSLPATRGKGQKKTTNSRDLQTTSHYVPL